MPYPPRFRWWMSAVVVPALLASCNTPPKESYVTGPSSTGLPPLSNMDASGVIELPDGASVTPTPDAGANVTADMRILEKDAAVDVASLPPDAAAGEAPPPPPGEDAAVCSAASATAKPVPVDIFVLMDRSGSMTLSVPGVIRD